MELGVGIKKPTRNWQASKYQRGGVLCALGPYPSTTPFLWETYIPTKDFFESDMYWVIPRVIKV